MLYRNTIRRAAPDLARIPLAKGARTYPFAMPESLVAVYAALGRLNRRSRTAPSSGWIAERDFVGDLIHSSETRSFGAYDHRKLDALFEDCYGGGVARFSQLDWWLSFELWRREHGLV
jgi:hypothetical protein